MRDPETAPSGLLSGKKLLRLVLLFYGVGLLSFWGYRHFRNPAIEKLVLGSDMHGYYQYLPVFFLQEWSDFQLLPWAKPYGEEKTLSVFTCGTAMLQAPFFLVAHAITEAGGLKADGYGPVYYFFVLLAGLFYATLGLLFLFKSLLRHSPLHTALPVTALIFYATNLFYYTIMGPGLSHVYSFCLMAAVVFQVPRFYAKPGFKNSLLLALPFSLAFLIRPTNGVIALYILLYNIGSFRDIRERIRFFTSRWYLLLSMAGLAFLIFVPQLLYWHYVTGDWIVYSYQEEGFTFWKNPQVMTVLFGKRGGWFVYTPVMLAASFFLFWMLLKKKPDAWAILLTMAAIVYLDASWWTPAFSASAGYRALIEFLPLMAFPLAHAYENTRHSPQKWMRITAGILIFIFVVFNIQFAFKYEPALWWDREWSSDILRRLLTF